MRLLPLALLVTACSENALIVKDGDPADTFDDVNPDILVDPLVVDFGALLPGESTSATVTISNVGEDALTLDALQLGALDSALSWTDVGVPFINAGESVDTVITWTPDVGGAWTNTLDVNSNDPDTPLVQVDLSGNVPAGDLLVTPASYDFGSLEVGLTATTVLTVANVGEGPITVSDWEYLAGDSDLHVIDAGGLTVLPAVIDAGTSTDVTIEYTPSAAGADDGSFGVTSNDPDEPLIVAQQYGNATEVDPCDGFSQTVTLLLTADDAWQGWIDGTSFSAPNQNAWNANDTMEWEMPCGDHTLALYATDTAHAVSGVIAVVWVEGAVRFVSGATSDWRMVDSAPPSDWTDITFDDSAWNIPQVCSSSSIWGSSPQPFYDQGAQWIWWTSTCSDLGQAWLRLNFSVP